MPTKPLQVVCSAPCAWTYVGKQNEKRDRMRTREAKARIKTRGQWMKEAQTAFNRYIRVRDSGHPCISCGRHHEGQWHAGHYMPTSTRPELRFDEMNVHLQCAPCNTYLSGNLIQYRKGLTKKIGIAMVEWLEGLHEAKHYSIDDLREIKSNYMALAKQIEKLLE